MSGLFITSCVKFLTRSAPKNFLPGLAGSPIMNRAHIAPTRKNIKKRGADLVFILFFLLINSVLLSDRIEFLELKLLVSMLLLVLSCVVRMTLSNAF
jgi:hypothetical protein